MPLSAMKEQRDSKHNLTRTLRGCLLMTRHSYNRHHQEYHPRRRTSASSNSRIILTWAQWKVLVIDEGAKKIIDNVVKEDDILNENIASMLRSSAC